MIAALYVQTDGAYFGLPDVDPWDEQRDARLYAGPWSVVAHPPCTRWSLLGLCRGYYDGKDDGCFEAALSAVRRFGGVLEHPAHTLAWKRFGLPRPSEHGWTTALGDYGATTWVDQGMYGFVNRKPTWLYACGVELTAMRWGTATERPNYRANRIGGGGSGSNRGAVRSRTPPAFRDELLAMARSAQPSLDVLPLATVAQDSHQYAGPTTETPSA